MGEEEKADTASGVREAQDSDITTRVEHLEQWRKTTPEGGRAGPRRLSRLLLRTVFNLHDVGSTIQVVGDRLLVHGKPRAVRWCDAKHTDVDGTITAVEESPVDGQAYGKVRISDTSTSGCTIDNPWLDAEQMERATAELMLAGISHEWADRYACGLVRLAMVPDADDGHGEATWKALFGHYDSARWEWMETVQVSALASSLFRALSRLTRIRTSRRLSSFSHPLTSLSLVVVLRLPSNLLSQ
jgi:hypothetical protein